MRVIAGSARRAKLKVLEGFETRPTSDKIKETLFNILMPVIYENSFLDLFAGSGGIGIEALSRGAKEAVFVEKNPKAVSIIKENLKITHFEDNSSVLCEDFNFALSRLERNRKKAFDIIFIDPPYQKGFEFFTLNFLKTSRLISEETLIIIEMSKNTSLEEIDSLYWYIFRIKEYKNNKHIFIRRRNESSSISGEF